MAEQSAFDTATAGAQSASIPGVDDLEFRALHQKTRYVVDTSDGWALVITRYRPVRQAYAQPLFGEPLLLVHGFSQNRHAWTSGEFVKSLLYFGLDVHIVELRGHGKSSVAFQRERCAKREKSLPSDLAWDWDIDSYFLYDIPAAVAGVRRITKRELIFYCGHSMGGMLGYGYAGLHPGHLAGLITIGSPSELGRGNLPLTFLAYMGPAVGKGIDIGLSGVNFGKRARHALSNARAILRRQPKGKKPETMAFRYLPIDAWLRSASKALERPGSSALLQRIIPRSTRVSKFERASQESMRWLLQEGGEKEPRKAIEQFMKWIRSRETVCYRTGYDFAEGFQKIKIPMAIIFGDLDPLASLQSTRSVYRGAKSDYLLWRPVKGNSHIELTMGHDVRQICYDIKSLIEYARTHRDRSPSLPRIHD